MSKFFLLKEAAKNNPFSSDYLFWIDGGIANTVCPEYVENLENIDSFMKTIEDKFLTLSFDYESQCEVHGFEAKTFSKYCGVESSNYVCRGGFFGGTPVLIDTLCPLYDSYLQKTLNSGFMGTEENILTILAHKFPQFVYRYCLPDSLVYSFFLSLK